MTVHIKTLFHLGFAFGRMMRKELLCVLVVVLAATVPSDAGDAMKFIAKGFVKVLEECKQELNLHDKLMVDLFYFWKLDYSRLTRDTGCAIICMSKKLDLIDDSGKMHHGNAKEYAKAHGADDELAMKLVNIIHGCEQEQDPHEDQCIWVLEVAKCFRTRIHDLQWSPMMETVIGEVLTEI